MTTRLRTLNGRWHFELRCTFLSKLISRSKSLALKKNALLSKKKEYSNSITVQCFDSGKKCCERFFLTVQRISKSENVEFLDSCWFIKVGRLAAPPICRTKDSQKTKDCHFRSRRHLFSTSLEMQKKINSNWREEKFLSGKKYLLFGVVERN